MFEKHKLPSLEMGILLILTVILVFGFGFFTSDKITGMSLIEGLNQITGAFVSRFSEDKADDMTALNEVEGMAGMERVRGR